MRTRLVIFQMSAATLLFGAQRVEGQVSYFAPRAIEPREEPVADADAEAKRARLEAECGSWVRPTEQAPISWAPVRNQECAAEFWGREGVEVLSGGTLRGEDKVFTSNLELVSDVVGWFRVGIGVNVAAASDEEESSEGESAADGEPAETLSRLANSAGTVAVSAQLPLIFRAQPAYNSTSAVVWTTTLGTDTPAAGGYLEDPAVALRTELDWAYQRRGMGERIDFLVGLRATGHWFNDAYGAKAGIDESFGALFEPRVGLTILEQTKVEVHWRTVRTDAFSRLGRIAVTLQQSR